MTDGHPPPKTFRLTTSAQVERVYEVQATSDDQARARLRTHMKDAEMLREGLVTELEDERKNTTPEKIRDAQEKPKLAAVEDAKQTIATGQAVVAAKKGSRTGSKAAS